MPAQPTGPLTIRKVETPADQKLFFEFPWTIYKGDPNWVPPLVSTRQHIIDKKKNPGWEYMTGDYFLAFRGTQPVGTIAALINHNHNKYWNENIGWFGLFECYEDQEVANLLLKTAAAHVKSLGATDGMRGPANLSMYDEAGLLIENFSAPVILMQYNHAYYQKLIENSGIGLEKCMDLYSWYSNPDMISEGGSLPPKLVRVVEKTKQRYGITLRKPDPKNLRKEVDLLRHLWNTCWTRNWGFYPLTDREADKLFKDLKDFVDVDLVRFAIVDGKNVGFLLGLPDLNQALHYAYPRPGVPELWYLLKVVWFWKIRRKVTGQRILLLGVEPEYRAKGVEAAMNLSYFEEGVRTRKYYDTDSGWVLESNQPMNQLAETFHAKLYKRYRIYQAPI